MCKPTGGSPHQEPAQGPAHTGSPHRGAAHTKSPHRGGSPHQEPTGGGAHTKSPQGGKPTPGVHRGVGGAHTRSPHMGGSPHQQPTQGGQPTPEALPAVLTTLARASPERPFGREGASVSRQAGLLWGLSGTMPLWYLEEPQQLWKSRCISGSAATCPQRSRIAPRAAAGAMVQANMFARMSRLIRSIVEGAGEVLGFGDFHARAVHRVLGAWGM
eukprot:364747-Chlamydomonas_euryale.AAC.7